MVTKQGFCRWDATPTFRGFDTFFGFLGGGEDYYTHNATVLHTQPGNLTSWLDFRDQETADFSHNGVYSTEAFTERATRIIEQHDTDEPMFLYMPFQAVHSLLQVPEEYLQYYDHIDDPTRKQYLAMVTSMDEAIGKVVESLEARDMWDDTLIVFLSDNGGNAVGGGSNFPYRGAKVTLFEGGTRVPTLVAGGILERTGYRHDGLFSMTDWYSTILSLAGVHDDDLGDIDGIDQSEMLLHGAESQRHEVLYHIDETDVAVQGRAAIRLDNYKLFYGFPGAYQGWYTPPELNGTSPLDLHPCPGHEETCDPENMYEDIVAWAGGEAVMNNTDIMLFDLDADPREETDISLLHPEVVASLLARLEAHMAGLRPAQWPPADPEGANPDAWGGVWSPGWC